MGNFLNFLSSSKKNNEDAVYDYAGNESPENNNMYAGGQEPEYDHNAAQYPDASTNKPVGGTIENLAKMLGPTPEERQAQQEQDNKRSANRQAWAGFFDGLRNLGNLYYTAKGATPQKLSDVNEQIRQQEERNRELKAQNEQQNENYYQKMYNLYNDAEQQRQQEEQREYMRELQAYRNTKNDDYNQERTKGQGLKNDYQSMLNDNLPSKLKLENKKTQSVIDKNKNTGDAALIRANKPTSRSSGNGTSRRNSGTGGRSEKGYYIFNDTRSTHKYYITPNEWRSTWPTMFKQLYSVYMSKIGDKRFMGDAAKFAGAKTPAQQEALVKEYWTDWKSTRGTMSRMDHNTNTQSSRKTTRTTARTNKKDLSALGIGK